MKCHKRLCSALTAFCVIFAASCSGGGAPAPVQTPSQTVSVTSAESASETEPEDTREDTASSEEETSADDTSEPEDTTEAASEADIDVESDDVPQTEALTDETEQSSTEEETVSAEETTAAAETTAAEETTTTSATAAETTTTAETTTVTSAETAAAAASKPAKPSPPQISEVSSPGTNVFKADNVTLDYSNCSGGYISVTYTGKTQLKMLLKKGDSQFDYDVYPAKGAQYFTLAQGSGKYTAEVYEKLDNGKYAKQFAEEFSAKIADEIKMFTYKNQFVDFSADSACVKKASEVCAGCTTNIEKVAAVFKYVTDNITYDKALAASVKAGYIPDPDSVLSKKKGICFDYASLTAAMLRSQGVPTRLIIGYASPNIYHAWNEVYIAEKGWIAAEIVLDGNGFKRIDATFYASASDKQTFADYIAKSGNYSDVYVY